MKPRSFALLSTPLLAALAALSPLSGQEPAPETPLVAVPGEPGFVLGYDQDRSQRMTVPVSIGDQGPYRFIVDTGAERTVIARELARDLRLGRGNTARVHSMSEVSDIQTVVIPALEVGGKRVRDIHAPALERRNLGAEGMLGVDSLQSQRVSFDFTRQEMTISPARRREEKWTDDADAIVVVARSRFGHLVLVDASVDGQKVWVIIDTGSEVTVGNSALRRKLERKGRMGATFPVTMLSVTGGRITADQTVVKRIRLGGMDINGMPVAFADVHPFRKLGLTDRPAILLGMDALELFDRVSVDFANRRVRMLAPPRSELPRETQVARAEGERPAG
jgi:predicted aspartyl protease